MLSEIEKNLRSHPFATPWFLQPHIKQTALTVYFPHFKTKMPKPQRKLIALPDGSQIAADCIFQSNKEKHPTIVVIDGFSNTTSSFFSRSMAHKAYSFGFNVILLMERAHGDTVKLTKSIYTGPLDDDLNIALDEFHKWGLSTFYLVGLSYGGYLTMSAVIRAEKEKRQKITGAVVIAPLASMDYTYHLAKDDFSHKFVLGMLKGMIKRRAKIDPPGTWDMGVLKQISSVREWYQTYMHTWGYPEKFSSFEEYEKISNLAPHLATIETPLLIINSYDDTLSPSSPFENLTNPNIITLLTKRGGHGGFFSLKKQYGDLDGHWAQNRAMEFIRLLADE